MKTVFVMLLTFFLTTSAWATPTVREILEKVDQNQNQESQILTYSMTIHGKRASRTMEAKSWIEGREKAYTEYLAPAREKGTKMLKLEDKLWTYYPSADRIVSISGHMLRQSVMGSDMSYEDMMERSSLVDDYNAILESVETINDRQTYKISLKAKRPDLAYQGVTLWVDTERFLSLRQELFAASGKLLKRIETLEVMQTSGRWTVKHMVYKDVLKEGKGTEFYIKEAQFDQKIPEIRFSKGQLRR